MNYSVDPGWCFVVVHLVCSVATAIDFKDDSEMDLGTVNGRAAVWHHLETVQPEVAVLSPPCTLFSALMRLWCRESMGEAKYQSSAFGG